MFKSLKILCNNVKNLNSDKIFIQIIQDKEVKEFILDLNRLGQLFEQGEDSEGNGLGNYSYFTESVRRGETFTYGGKSSKKTVNDHITLYDTGKFYKSFFVRVYKDGFTIVANSIVDDGKDLTKIYGEKILGLSNYSKVELYKKIEPMVVQQIKKSILKGVL